MNILTPVDLSDLYMHNDIILLEEEYNELVAQTPKFLTDKFDIDEFEKVAVHIEKIKLLAQHINEVLKKFNKVVKITQIDELRQYEII